MSDPTAAVTASLLSDAQRACVERVLAEIPSNVIEAKVLSERAGVGLQLELEDGARMLLKVSRVGAPEEIETEVATLRHLGAGYEQRLSAYAVERDTAAVLLHWIAGGSLHSRWRRNASDIRQQHADLQCVARKIASIHDSGIVHGDLQPPHIRFVDELVEIIDFGVAGAADEPFGGGLIHYLAPEYAAALLRGEQAVRTREGDWYALLASAFVSAADGRTPVTYPVEATRDVKLEAIAAATIEPERCDTQFTRELAHALLLPARERRDWLMRS